MDIRSLARKIACLPSSAAVHAAAYFNPRIARIRVEAGYSVEIISVLDYYDGQRLFRFVCSWTGARAPKYMALDALGKPIDVSPMLVSDIQSNGEVNRAEFSIALPKNVSGFHFGSAQTGFMSVTLGGIKAYVRYRDSLMVNPAVDSRYQSWFKKHRLETDANNSSIVKNSDNGPLLSIITPLFNTPINYFNELVKSVLAQTYSNWELVLVNASPENKELAGALEELSDPRIKTVQLESNMGITKNTEAGIKASSGSYVAFLDHDDLLEPTILEEYFKVLTERPGVKLLYCDEDSVLGDEGKFFEPRFKPDFNLDLLLTHNYFVHMLMVSREAYDGIGGYLGDVDGSQDYDLSLRIGRTAECVAHIPQVLYHWRAHDLSTNGGQVEAKPYVIESSKRVLRGYFDGSGIEIDAHETDLPCVFDVEYPRSEHCDTSLVVAYSGAVDLLELVASMDSQRGSAIREIICVGSYPATLLQEFGIEGEEDLTLLLKEFSGCDVKLIEADSDLNRTAKYSIGANASSGDYLMFVDSCVRFGGEDAVGVLRDMFCRSEVGIASAKTMTMDGVNYHVGLCVKEDGSFGYLNQGFIHGMGGGYHGCAECCCDYSAVDSMCFMMRKADYENVGGFNIDYETDLASSVDFSFGIRDAAKLVLVNPDALVSAYSEMGTLELGKSYILPGSKDFEMLWSNWPEDYRRDVLANPNVDLSSSYFRLKVD